jgi:hypothetical protein
MERAALIVPRDTGGTVAVEGAIVLLSLGVSNTFQEFETFIEVVVADGRVNSQLVMVNGAQGAKPLSDWASDETAVWDTVDQRLAEADVTPAQVQAAWLKIPDEEAGSPTMEAASEDAGKLQSIVSQLDLRFPNLQVVYLSSRVYGGFIREVGRTEPNAYQDGYAVKWAIEAQIAGTPGLDPRPGSAEAPWASWGPYLWADGSMPRSDGLSWTCEDFQSGGQQGVHLAETGLIKVAGLLWEHFSTSATSASWFLTEGAVVTTSPTASTLPVTTTTNSNSSATTASPRPTSESIEDPTTTSVTSTEQVSRANPAITILAVALGGIGLGALLFRRRAE